MNPEFDQKVAELLNLHNEEIFEKIASETLAQIDADENPLSQIGRNLCSLYISEPYAFDRILSALCGWNFKHLLILAEVIEDDAGIRILEEPGKKTWMPVTKEQIHNALLNGKTLLDILTFSPGQECEIYKAPEFRPDDTVIYVPDIYLNKIPTDYPITDPEKLQEVLQSCYTGKDFITEACGDEKVARALFSYVDWQHPSSAWPEVEEAIE